jgi:hypothetical protein
MIEIKIYIYTSHEHLGSYGINFRDFAKYFSVGALAGDLSAGIGAGVSSAIAGGSFIAGTLCKCKYSWKRYVAFFMDIKIEWRKISDGNVLLF